VCVALFFSKHQLVQIGGLITILGFVIYFVGTHKPFFVPMYNDVDVRLTVFVFAVLQLGAGSYAERGTDSTGTFFFVGAVAAVAGLCVVALYSLVLDVRSLWEEHRNKFYSIEQRHKQMKHNLLAQLGDVNADESTMEMANEFLSSLKKPVEGSDQSPAFPRRNSFSLGEVELDDLYVV